MEDHVQRVLDEIDRSWESELDFLRRLVRERSVLGEEASVQRVVFDGLGEMGLEPEYQEISADRIEGLPGYSLPDRPYEGRPNVLARLGAAGGGGRSLILNGHVDVVPVTPEHHWTYDPWGAEVVDGRMYGRGAADMKSGVAAMMFAVRAIARSGVGLCGDVYLQTVIEEERTGNGALAALAALAAAGTYDGGQRADAAIIPEPFGQTALIAQVGVAWLRVTVRGKGAHVQSGDTATNAILEAYKLIEVLGRLEAEANEAPKHEAFSDHPHPLNFNVGVIRGGDWTSSVPEECVFEVRISAYPGEDLDRVKEGVRDRLLAAAREDEWLSENPPLVEFVGFHAEGCTVDEDETVVRALAKAHESVTSGTLAHYSSTATTDARFFNLYYGIPATCYGPVGANLHAPDEWVDLGSVREVTKVLALTVMDWCGVSDRDSGTPSAASG